MGLTASVATNFLSSQVTFHGADGRTYFFPSGSTESDGIPAGGHTQSFDITCSVVSKSDGLLQLDGNTSGSYIKMPGPFSPTHVIYFLSSSFDSASGDLINGNIGDGVTQDDNVHTASFGEEQHKDANTFAAELFACFSRSFFKQYGTINSLSRAPMSVSNLNGPAFTVHSRFTGSYPVLYNPTLTSSFGFEIRFRN